MLRPSRRLVLAAAAAALAASAALPAAAPAKTPPRCTVPMLMGELRRPSAAAGQRFATLVLTNVTRRTCSLSGSPGALLLGARNRPLPTNVVWTRIRRLQTAVLAPGQRAVASLQWSAIAGTGDRRTGACQPTPARIEITPPNATRHLVLPWRYGPVCQRGRIFISPVSRG